MNEKEIGEIRRRINPEKTSISKLRGAYVSGENEIISTFDSSLAMLNEIETEYLLSIIKKALSGTLHKNLIDIEFSTEQVVSGEEHKLLSEIRKPTKEGDEAVRALYQKIMESVHIEGNYIIIIANDSYDVPSYGKGGEKDDSTTVFTYFLCAVCPIKLTKAQLSYYGNEFHTIAANSVIAPPEIGFMFPAFDDRNANIYASLLYTKDSGDAHSDFIDAIFKSKAPMPAKAQKDTFDAVLENSIDKACSFEVIEAVHSKISTMVEEHKTAKIPEPLMISKGTVKNILTDCKINEEAINNFDSEFEREFGRGAELSPKNIVDTKKFEVKTPDVTIKVNPERTDLIKTEVIDGTKYIMIRAESDVTVNGVNITIDDNL